jgi:cytosine deaminase
VTVAAATNNILNAFTPMGTGDLALMGYLMTAAAHMGTERDVADILAMLTEHPARILRLPDYGLRVGARADLVLWETERAAEVVTTMAPRRLVVKAGRLSLEHERTCREFWRSGA